MTRMDESLPCHRLIGLIAGPVLACMLLALPAPAGRSGQGSAIAAVGARMALWWMTEAIPLAVTALLPLILFPVPGLRGLEATAASYWAETGCAAVDPTAACPPHPKPLSPRKRAERGLQC
jgi:di/tricarboxylate transporter